MALHDVNTNQRSLHSDCMMFTSCLQDTYRRTYDRAGIQNYEDSGILVVPFDYTRTKHITEAFPVMKNARPMDCHLGPYCGVPMKIPVIGMLHPK